MDLTIDFGSGGNAKNYQRFGWSGSEVLGTWSLGAESSLELPVGLNEPHWLTLELDGCRVPGEQSAQRLGISFNEKLVGDVEIRSDERIDIVIPAASEQSGPSKIGFFHPDYRIPRPRLA